MTVASTGRRTFFHAPGANALLAAADFDFSKTQARVFLLGYLMLLESMDQLEADGSTGAAKVLRAAREAGLIAAVDCVSTPNPQFREIALASLAEADVFFANEML
jgi:sugar/nucleoside kinase (ribokinase family)